MLGARVVYAVVLLLVRKNGQRTVGQLTSFNLLAVVRSAPGWRIRWSVEHTSLSGALMLVVRLPASNRDPGVVTARCRRIEGMIGGAPGMLARRGQLFRDGLARQVMSARDCALSGWLSDAGACRARCA